MAVSRKLIIGNQNSGDPNETFAIAKVYGPDEITVDALIKKIADAVKADGFVTESKEVQPDTARNWKITKI